MRGPDVKRAQNDLNWWADRFNLNKTTADGEWGPDSRRLYRQVFYLLGATKARIVDAFTQHEQELVQQHTKPTLPKGLSRGARQRSGVRRAARRRKLAATKKGILAANRYALAQIGTTEVPAGSNWGPKVGGWLKASGLGFAAAWCGAFTNAVLRAGGFKAQNRWVYTPAMLADARNGNFGLTVVAARYAQAGDCKLFKWPGVSRDSCDHVAYCINADETVEGNTSPGVSGSQNNGGGVYRRDRGDANVAGVARPDWSLVR